MMRYNQPHPDEQMTMDTPRGISNITYNRQGLPTRVTFSDGSKVDYVYSFSGELKSMKAYSKPVNAQGVTQITSMRDYCGDFIFENNALSMVNFPGGYFDGDGNPNYRHTDWQGNVTIVTNSDGKIAQHTGYYPYGEPWSEPSGQPYLYGGKERLREGGLYEYDFGARRYNSALALWTTPDPVVHGQHSPYTYCAGNPIRYIDPNGMEFTEGSKEIVQSFENLITSKLNLIEFQIYQLRNSFRSKYFSHIERKEIIEKIAEKKGEHNALLQVENEISALKNSNQMYNIKIDSEQKEGLSKSYYNFDTDEFDIVLCDGYNYGSLAHEMKHGYQFEIGNFSTSGYESGYPYYDKTDEVEAYERGALFGEPFDGVLPSRYDSLQTHPESAENYFTKGNNIRLNPQIIAEGSASAFRFRGKTYRSCKVIPRIE